MGELKVLPLLSTHGISIASGSSGSIPSKCYGPKIGIAKGKKTKGNKEGHRARVSAMTHTCYMLLFISLAFFPFAILTLGPEPYEGMDPNEPDAKLIPCILNSGVTFNSPTRSTLMQYDKV